MLDKVALKSIALELVAALPPPKANPDRDSEGDFLPIVIQTRRARAIRRISEITNMRGWQIAVTRALDANQASYIDDLPDKAVMELQDDLEHYEVCAQMGCDLQDALPAR